MVQESIFKSVAIIGGGPAGCACAKFLQDFADVFVFDKNKFLNTILPTGGGRCNLAYCEYDFKELAKNYPRGEKFLYSVFSQFGTQDTIDFFKDIGVETYVQDDWRIFPNSNSSKEVREKLLKSLDCNFVNEEVFEIEKKDNCFKIVTDKSSYAFDYVVISVGGHSNFNMLKDLGVNIIEPTQSLVGLKTKEDLSSLAGISLKDVMLTVDDKKYNGDLLFTHKGVSGPVIYKISSIYARKDFPYIIKIRFTEDFNFQELLNKNPHKEIKNLTGKMIPRSLAEFLLNELSIAPDTPCHKINSVLRNKIYSALTDFEIITTGKVPDSEVVTCGGVDLKEVNPKTMEHKTIGGLYFCGEVLDIDGFCGGFNLQNCWSGAYVAANAIIHSK